MMGFGRIQEVTELVVDLEVGMASWKCMGWLVWHKVEITFAGGEPDGIAGSVLGKDIPRNKFHQTLEVEGVCSCINNVYLVSINCVFHHLFQPASNTIMLGG